MAQHKRSLAIGFSLMLVNRLTGLVLPASSKYLIDDIAMGVLFWLNWKLTAITLLILVAFSSMMAIAFTRLRPLFRERGKINADVTGRLAETIGGIRIVKVYTAERRERLTFAKG